MLTVLTCQVLLSFCLLHILTHFVVYVAIAVVQTSVLLKQKQSSTASPLLVSNISSSAIINNIPYSVHTILIIKPVDLSNTINENKVIAYMGATMYRKSVYMIIETTVSMNYQQSAFDIDNIHCAT